ncbi:hypothetical protein GCM10007352_16510 [Mucilaginibacter phyllosphaerae]|nr:hypothetical protein GCM10007352_16510 [Mucilaginibacter phyllosphaerae]
MAQIEDRTYYDKNGWPAKSSDSIYYMQTIRPDSASKLFIVQQYYKNGQPKLIGKSISLTSLKFDGNVIEYYNNAKRKIMANYKDGNRFGSYYEYFPSGKLYVHKEYTLKKGPSDSLNFTIQNVYDTTGVVTATDGNGVYSQYDQNFTHVTESGPIKNGKRNGEWKGAYKERDITFVETYTDGELLSGEASSMGQKSSYKKRFIVPEFPGGDVAFGRFLGTHMRYPIIDLQNKVQGRVVLTFIIEKDGKITNLEILSSLSSTTDEEAVKTLTASSPWINGYEFGFPATIRYSMPITFSMANN